MKNNDLLNIDDDNIEYDKLSILLNDIDKSEKNSFIKNAINNKELLINEINRNKVIRENNRLKQIKYINRHHKNIDLSSIIVDMLDDRELKILYDKCLYENRSFIKKIIEYLFYN